MWEGWLLLVPYVVGPIYLFLAGRRLGEMFADKVPFSVWSWQAQNMCWCFGSLMFHSVAIQRGCFY